MHGKKTRELVLPGDVSACVIYLPIAIAPASVAMPALSLAVTAAACRFAATTVSSGALSSLFSLLSISSSVFVASARHSQPSRIADCERALLPWSSLGSSAIFTAIRRASSRVRSLAADRRPGSFASARVRLCGSFATPSDFLHRRHYHLWT
jgi:hypothetical protein